MNVVSETADPWIVLFGVGVAVVGIQMAADPDSIVAKVLPFHQPQARIIAGVDGQGAVLLPLLWTALYGVALMTLARIFLGSRLDVTNRSTAIRQRPGALWSEYAE